MQRRQVLAAASTLFVAGCTGPAASAPEEPTGTPTGSVALEGTGFDVTDAGCGVEREAAAVAFDADAVSVTGTTSGADACRSARLADATYDASTDRFDVVVETYRAETGGCAQCITEIDYEATASFSGGLPGTVVVTHRSRGGDREVERASP
jgi:predicted secreted protein